jgi:hypothetical protein
MKFVSIGLLAAVMISACPVTVLAADPPPPPLIIETTRPGMEPVNARKLDLAKRYFVAVGLDATMNQMMGQMIPLIIDTQIRSDPEMARMMTPELRQALTEVAQEWVMEQMPSLKEKMAVITAEVFTEQELAEMVAFYEGPTGRSINAKSSLLMSRMGELEGVMKTPDMADITRRLCKKIDCTAKPRSNRS